MSDIEQLLDEELVSEIEGLGSLELGSDDYAVTADNVGKLLAKSIELKKLEIEADDKIKTCRLWYLGSIKELKIRRNRNCDIYERTSII